MRIRRSRTAEEVADEKPEKKQRFSNVRVQAFMRGVLTYKLDSKECYAAKHYRWYFVGRCGVAFCRALEDGTFKLSINGRAGEELAPFKNEHDLHIYLIEELEA